jgi:ribosomal-protein-alanine N-acetyltransferase
MDVLQTIKRLLVPIGDAPSEGVIPAPATVYAIQTLTEKHLKEVLRLNIRCFKNGENYTKHTFTYLLNEPNTLSYKIVTADDEIVGFVFVMINANGAAHLTTIGVAPEHRRRHLAARLLEHMDNALRKREITTVMLEVRVSNVAAQNLYRRLGYNVVQRIANYYSNGEDCFLMMKSLV